MLFTRKVFSSEEYPAARVATIEISPREAGAILEIMGEVERMKDHVYGHPDHISFEDYTPDWYEKESEGENGEVTPVGEPISKDLGRINIGRDGVFWTCYEKHCNTLYETHEVTKEELEAMLAGVK